MSDPHVDPSDQALARYHRQRLLPGVGDVGQRRLLASAALIVGVGALGTVVAEALARAGVGQLVLVDRDVVELTNLQRQTLFDEQDASDAVPKAVAAAARLARINSGVRVEAVVEHFSATTARRLLGNAPRTDKHASEQIGVIVDCTDNFSTRYLLNDLAVARGLPLVYGGAVGTHGVGLTIVPTGEHRTACLRCVFPDAPGPGDSPTCDVAGVLGPATGIIGNTQAAEAIKVLLGRADAVDRTLREIDVWSGRMRAIDLADARRDDCPCCGRRQFEYLDSGGQEPTLTLCGSNAVQITPVSVVLAPGSIDLPKLTQALALHGTFKATPHMVRGVLRGAGRDRQEIKLTVFADGRAIVDGTSDPVAARAIYDRFVGT